MTRVVVVGAGPAGLTAAWQLARKGIEVRVIERGTTIGGMAASVEVAGQRVDLGSHRLHPAMAPHLLGAIQELLGSDLQVRPRRGRLRFGDRWVAFPLRAGDIARHAPPRFLAGAALDALLRPLRRARGDTFADVVNERLGPTMLRSFYGPYARKLWGEDAEALDGELARRRISATGPAALAARLLRPGGSAMFLYPRRGYGQIVERLADAAVAAGARIDTGVAVEAVRPAADAVTVVAGGRSDTADRMLWTAPIAALAEVAGASADVRAVAPALAHRAMVLVYLVVDRPQYTPFDAHYIPGPQTPVTRFSEPKNYRDGPDPVDRTVLCFEVPCAKGDATWNAPDDELGAVAMRALRSSGLPAPVVVAVETRRLPRVYPVLRAETVDAFDAMERWAADLGRVTVLGRQGLFVGDNLHHVMAMGWDAAALLSPGGVWDAAAWAARLSGYRDHVVAD